MAERKQEIPVSFLAIAPFVERTIISPRESAQMGKDWMRWGDRNIYPDYIAGLSAECTTLRTVQQGLVDYIIGNGVRVSRPFPAGVDGRGMTEREFVKRTAKAIARLGGFAWQLLPTRDGAVAGAVPLRVEFIRSNRDNTVFWYSEDWAAKGRRGDALVYGKWTGTFPRDREGRYLPAIHFVKCWGDDTYPEPIYAAAVKACETERQIDEFHLGNLERGFMGSYLVNFLNGNPSDEIKKQIERDFMQKFAGASNAGRVMFNFATDKDHAAILQKMEVADYGEKYDTLAKTCRGRIFTAFRANPNLFGIATEDNGFNAEEYDSSFKLFNRTVVAPLQECICEAWHRCTGTDMTIEPFTLDGGEQAAGEPVNDETEGR